MLQICRAFLIFIVPLYGGYIGAPASNLLIYALLSRRMVSLGLWSAGTKQLWTMGGSIGVLKGWLAMFWWSF